MKYLIAFPWRTSWDQQRQSHTLVGNCPGVTSCTLLSWYGSSCLGWGSRGATHSWELSPTLDNWGKSKIGHHLVKSFLKTKEYYVISFFTNFSNKIMNEIWTILGDVLNNFFGSGKTFRIQNFVHILHNKI